jgi:hypothetical protein
MHIENGQNLTRYGDSLFSCYPHKKRLGHLQRADPNDHSVFEHVRGDRKVLPTGRPKQTAGAGPTHSRPICGREMRSGGQRPWWLGVRACPCLARMSVNPKKGHGGATQKIVSDHLPTQATTTLPYPYSPCRRPRLAVAYSRSSPQPGSTVFEPSSSSWWARRA